jgi:hypothetical protein
MVDLWPNIGVSQQLQKAKEVTAFAQDRRRIMHMPSTLAAEMLQDESFDFVFLDADHSYKAVKEDIEAWGPKVRPGGWLCGHDYGKPALGVTQAVSEFVEATGLFLELGQNTTWFIKLP